MGQSRSMGQSRCMGQSKFVSSMQVDLVYRGADKAWSRSESAHEAANRSREMSSADASAAMVKNVGVGTRPVSILRNVSGESPAAALTCVILRSPRASRKRFPSLRPRRCSGRVSGVRTMFCDSNTGIVIGAMRYDAPPVEVAPDG
jgi:hypothetical protein